LVHVSEFVSYVVTALEAEKSAVATEPVASATGGGVTSTGLEGATNTGSGIGNSGSTSKQSAACALRPSVAVVLGLLVVLGFHLFLWEQSISGVCHIQLDSKHPSSPGQHSPVSLFDRYITNSNNRVMENTAI
jgi:hypothetical protein